MTTDVLGRLVEVLAGKPLVEVFAERVLGLLGMTDTGFWTTDTDRLAALYLPAPGTKQVVRNDVLGALGTARPDCFSGGGGLVCTAADYHRFTQMLLRGGPQPTHRRADDEQPPTRSRRPRGLRQATVRRDAV